jgi:outer membrane immunogenic protein
MRLLIVVRLLIATAISLAAVAGGSAADLPVRGPVYAKSPPPAVFSWTGFYIGGNAGVAINNSSYQLDPTGCFLTGCGVGGVAANAFRTFTGNFNRSNFTGGGQVGYNLQYGGHWLAGIEADINYNGVNDSFNGRVPLTGLLNGGLPPVAQSQHFDWLGTVRARVGFLPSDRLLVYATGGLAYGHVSAATNVLFISTTDQYAGSASVTRFGWTAGGGAEWVIAGNWSAKAEYLYVDLGSFNYVDACVTPGFICGTPFPTYTSHLTTREHVFRLGVNYKIN